MVGTGDLNLAEILADIRVNMVRKADIDGIVASAVSSAMAPFQSRLDQAEKAIEALHKAIDQMKGEAQSAPTDGEPSGKKGRTSKQVPRDV